MKLNISPDLSLPLDFVTQTQAILAKRGVGKSYTASVQAEEMLAARQQVIAIDPTGGWYGLKSSLDGKSAGYPIAVFGGEHADVPLEEHAAEVIAGAIVERRFSAIVDLSLFRKGAMQRFMAPFLETLYRLNREAVHVFVDEADAFAPQKPFGEEARTLGAMEDLVRRGRKRGIGTTLITQRPAVISKNVLTQCEVLCVLRLVHPRDIDTVMEWVNVHADPDEAQQMIVSLPSLPVGDAWFWCPAWDLFKRVHIRERQTFDSSATPKAGEKVRQPRVLADIDIRQLGEQIKSTVEQAKANDPAHLKRRIAELEKQLAQRPKEQVEKTVEKVVEVPVLKNGQLDKTHKLADRLQTFVEKLTSETAELRRLIEPAAAPRPVLPAAAVRALDRTPPPVRRQPVAPRPVQSPISGDLTISKVQQRILNALAWYESLGIAEPTVTQIGAVALIDPTGGYFSNTVGPLSSAGLVERGTGKLRLTDAGRRLAEPVESVGSLDEYHDVLRNRVRKMRSASGKTIEMLDVIIGAGGESLTTAQIGEAVGVDHTGGYFSNSIGPLSTAGLIERRQGVVTPTTVLFPAGLEART